MSTGDATQLTSRLRGRAGSRLRRTAELTSALLAIACYAGTVGNGFCHDDGPIVETNPHVNQPGKWVAIWTTDHWEAAGRRWEHRDLLYRPVAITSYRLVYNFLGPAAWSQHALNVLLHALASVLVVCVARRLTEDDRASWLAGVLFAVLPIHSEVVASIVGRADELAALGMLLAMLAHARVVLSANRSARVLWSVAGAAAVFMSMGAKESGAVAALCVIAFDVLLHGKTRAGGCARRTWSGAATLRRTAYLAIPVAAYSLLRLGALDGVLAQHAPLTRTINVLSGAPLWQRALGVAQLWGMYWSKTVWPRTLCIEYSINAVRLATSLLDRYVVVGLLTSLALVGLAVRDWRRGSRLSAWLLGLCVLSYLPTSNALVLMRAFFAERIWYVPSVWAVVLIACLIARITKSWRGRILLAVVVILMTGRCMMRVREWKDNQALYAAAYRDHPEGVQALRLYGRTLIEGDEPDRGIALLRRAIEIDLGYADAHRDLGRALLRTGRYAEAVQSLQTADMMAPGQPPTVAALEEAKERLAKRAVGEIATLRRRVEARPDDLDAHLALISTLRTAGDLEAARDHLERHRTRFGDSSRWAREYAVTLVLFNDLEGAIGHYEQAVLLAPRNVEATVELAMLLLERNARDDLARAWRYLQRAEEVAHNSVRVLVCRAELHAHAGELEDAIRTYRRAIALEPTSSRRRSVLIQRLRALGG